jgi:hypothetical protein
MSFHDLLFVSGTFHDELFTVAGTATVLGTEWLTQILRDLEKQEINDLTEELTDLEKQDVSKSWIDYEWIEPGLADYTPLDEVLIGLE